MALGLTYRWPHLRALEVGGFTVQELVEAVNSGNIFFVLGKVKEAGRTGTLAQELPVLLRAYALFHAVVAAAACALAVLRLRAVALRQASRPGKAERFVGARPRVGGDPMMWKETVIEGGLRLNWLGALVVVAIVVLSFWPAVSILQNHADRGSLGAYRVDNWMGREINIWVRSAGTLVACVMLMTVAVRAAGSISGERERQTFDGLLASPLTAGEILFAKWLGSLLSVRLGWLWLLGIWAVGVATGGLLPVAVPFLVAFWLVYASVLALVGLWFSLTCRNTTRAVMATLGTALALSFGHWVPWMLCLAGRMFSPGVADIGLVQVGMTPPAALALFAFHGAEFEHLTGESAKMVFNPPLGVALWVIGGLALWSVLYQRFCNTTNRDTILVAEKPFDRRRPQLAAPAADPPPPPEASPSPAQLRGAVLVEDSPAVPDRPPTRLSGAKLVEETWAPPRPPGPPASNG
jgi:hypothetical protein